MRISQIPPVHYQKRLADWSQQNAKTNNRNTETVATTNTNSETAYPLSQRRLSRTGWMASWQIGATLRGLGRTLPTPPTLFVRHRRDKDDVDADDDDDNYECLLVTKNYL